MFEHKNLGNISEDSIESTAADTLFVKILTTIMNLNSTKTTRGSFGLVSDRLKLPSILNLKVNIAPKLENERSPSSFLALFLASSVDLGDTPKLRQIPTIYRLGITSLLTPS